MRSKTPKILLVSRSVPPGVSGSSVIIGNLARQFARDEMLVVGSWFAGSPAVKWQADWPKIIYATITPPDGWRGARLLRWAQFPWLLLRLWWVNLRQRPDVILGVYPDEIYLFAAYLVSLTTGKPLHLYFHNTYLQHGRGHTNMIAEWLQPRVFKHARHVFVMSKAMQKLYSSYYPELVCTPLTHSFNEIPPDLQTLPSPDVVGKPLRVALSGGVNASNEGAVEDIAAAVKGLPDVELWIYTRTNQHYLKQLGVDGSQFHITTVSRDDLIAELQKVDILFLPHGFSERESAEEIETIFPTRTIEYLIAGRPILAHVPEGCFIGDFLREHNCALIVTDPSPDALKQAIIRLGTDTTLRGQLVQNAVRAANQFHAPVVAQHLRDVIQNNPVQLAPELT